MTASDVPSQDFSNDLAQSEDGVRLVETDTTFEWWYFDTVMDDGSTCVMSFLNKEPFCQGGLSPTLLLNISRPGEPLIAVEQAEPSASYSAALDHCDVRMGAQSVSGDLRTYVIHTEVVTTGGVDVVVDLTLNRTVPSYRVGPFKTPEMCALQWLGEQVIIAAGTVEGTMTIGGVATGVNGSCYHDHQWGGQSVPCAAGGAPEMRHANGLIPSSWYWGRAQIDGHAMVFAQILTRSEPGGPEAPADVMLLFSREDGNLFTYADDLSAVTVTRTQASDLADEFPSLDVAWQDATGNEVTLHYEPGELIGEFGRPTKTGKLPYRRYLSDVTMTSRFNGEDVSLGPAKMIWEENHFA